MTVGLKTADDSSYVWTEGICVVCNQSFKRKFPTQKCCGPECKTAFIKNYQKSHAEKLRDQVYALFDNKCARCGEQDKIVLTIDHIEAVGKNRKPTILTYIEILESPEQAAKYQLLCRNCNWRKMIENNERNPKAPEFITHMEFISLALQVYDLQMVVTELQSWMKTIPVGESSMGKIPPSPQAQQLVDRVLPHLALIKNKEGRIDAAKIRFVLFEKEQLRIGHNKAYDIKKLIEGREETQQIDKLLSKA